MKDAVGPVLRVCEELELVIEAIVEDNPGRTVEVIDKGSYVRVQASGFLHVTLATLQRRLGSSFEMRKLESMLASFAGRIDTSTRETTFSLGETAAEGDKATS